MDWVGVVGFEVKNIGTSLISTPFSLHCMGQSKQWSTSGTRIAWLISMIKRSPESQHVYLMMTLAFQAGCKGSKPLTITTLGCLWISKAFWPTTQVSACESNSTSSTSTLHWLQVLSIAWGRLTVRMLHTCRRDPKTGLCWQISYITLLPPG